MTKHISDETIEKLQEWGAGHARISKIWAFGDYAKGTVNPDSELDLALEFHKMDIGKAHSELMEHRRHWIHELTELLGIRVRHIELANDPNGRAFNDVKEHGLLLYHKKEKRETSV
jgi:predicted nucleotidyltransferase